MWLLVPIAIFTALFIPYLYLIPGNDGNLEYLFAYHTQHGDHFNNWLLTHPPFKLFLFILFFNLFGYMAIGYVGLLMGIAGIVALYFLAKTLFDEKTALLSSLLLALSGLYSSIGIFSINDFVMTVLLLVAFAFYSKSKHTWYVIFASLAVFTKETAILFACSVLVAEFLFTKRVKLIHFLPFVFLIGWMVFLQQSGHTLWNDYNFSQTADKGIIVTILNNLFTFQFLNQYAYGNWLHLFVFNFNWVFWLLALFSFRYIKNLRRKEFVVIGLFIVAFTLTILSLQTFTINRYTLPILPFVYLFAGVTLSRMPCKYVVIPIVIIISLLSYFTSNDPVSNTIWPKTDVLGEKIYLNVKMDGYDGISYNNQYLEIMKRRTELLHTGKCDLPHMLAYDPLTLKLHNIDCVPPK